MLAERVLKREGLLSKECAGRGASKDAGPAAGEERAQGGA